VRLTLNIDAKHVQPSLIGIPSFSGEPSRNRVQRHGFHFLGRVVIAWLFDVARSRDAVDADSPPPAIAPLSWHPIGRREATFYARRRDRVGRSVLLLDVGSTGSWATPIGTPTHCGTALLRVRPRLGGRRLNEKASVNLHIFTGSRERKRKPDNPGCHPSWACVSLKSTSERQR